VARATRLTVALFGMSALLAVGLVVVGGVRFDAPTIGLALAGAALCLALTTVFLMTQALSRNEVDLLLTSEGQDHSVDRRELREERHRLLRAIKELDFDYEMGKLSDADHRSVRLSYENRAIDVMRALGGDPPLHPDLRAVLDGTPTAGDHEEPAPGPAGGEAGACGACGKASDSDATFCKHCGARQRDPDEHPVPEATP